LEPRPVVEIAGIGHLTAEVIEQICSKQGLVRLVG
jgi:hypothetical protein